MTTIRRTVLAGGALALGMASFVTTAASPRSCRHCLRPLQSCGMDSALRLAWPSTRQATSTLRSGGRRRLQDRFTGLPLNFRRGLSGPSGLTIGPDGTIYVASSSRDEVYRFTPVGSLPLYDLII